jgi:hypothetical protein
MRIQSFEQAAPEKRIEKSDSQKNGGYSAHHGEKDNLGISAQNVEALPVQAPGSFQSAHSLPPMRRKTKAATNYTNLTKPIPTLLLFTESIDAKQTISRRGDA